MNIQYISNNPGGYFRTNDETWKKLNNAGWEVQWFKEKQWHNQLATSAIKRNVKDLKDVEKEWALITGLNILEPGCGCFSCQGQPVHEFVELDEDDDII